MKKEIIVLIVCVVFVLGVVVGASGAVKQEEVKAIINHGLNYQGSTYLPARAIAEALSIAVDYDASSQTVYLGEKGKTPLTSEHFNHLWYYQLSFDESQLFVNGKQYRSGILYTGKDGFSEMGGFVQPRGQFQKFGGVACLEDNDGTTDEVTIKIREKDQSGKVLKELNLKKGESIAFEIDIPEIQELYIQNLVYERVPKNTQPDVMVLADPYFK